VLHDPALRELQMPAVVLRVPDGDQDPGRFASLEDHDDFVGLRTLEILADKVVSPTRRSVQEGDVPCLGSVLDPVMELIGDVAEGVPAHPLMIPVRVKEPDDPLGLLERLDEPIEQDAIEAPVPEPDAILMVLVERVHGRSSCVVRYQERIAMNASAGTA